jgi:hypothetical protein
VGAEDTVTAALEGLTVSPRFVQGGKGQYNWGDPLDDGGIEEEVAAAEADLMR